MAGGFVKECCVDFFEYDTPMIVHIKNRTVGVINRGVQCAILAYIVFYGILYEKGYQEFEDIRSSVTTKLKGILYENDPEYRQKTWDVADYVIPPQEANAFFIITSVVTTPMQSQGVCAEAPKIRAALCKTDADCEAQKGVITPTGNGPFTGKCLETLNPAQNVCEIEGWCPVEVDTPDTLMTFNNSVNFTVLIKNNIEFPKFGFRKRNIMDWYATDSELGKCRWKPEDPVDKYCPIFILGDIAKASGVDYSSKLTTGGIIKIIIDWDCNLDFSGEYCMPEYSFSWLDKGNFTVSVGFNFRFADHFFMKDSNNKTRFYRNLYKAVGIHFLVEVRGQAGKFHLVNLMFNIGSGMGLLGIASILSDIVVLNFLKASKIYKDRKIQVVDVEVYKKLQEETSGNHEAKETEDADGKIKPTVENNDKL